MVSLREGGGGTVTILSGTAGGRLTITECSGGGWSTTTTLRVGGGTGPSAREDSRRGMPTPRTDARIPRKTIPHAFIPYRRTCGSAGPKKDRAGPARRQDRPFPQFQRT